MPCSLPLLALARCSRFLQRISSIRLRAALSPLSRKHCALPPTLLSPAAAEWRLAEPGFWGWRRASARSFLPVLRLLVCVWWWWCPLRPCSCCVWYLPGASAVSLACPSVWLCCVGFGFAHRLLCVCGVSCPTAPVRRACVWCSCFSSALCPMCRACHNSISMILSCACQAPAATAHGTLHPARSVPGASTGQQHHDDTRCVLRCPCKSSDS